MPGKGFNFLRRSGDRIPHLPATAIPVTIDMYRAEGRLLFEVIQAPFDARLVSDHWQHLLRPDNAAIVTAVLYKDKSTGCDDVLIRWSEQCSDPNRLLPNGIRPIAALTSHNVRTVTDENGVDQNQYGRWIEISATYDDREQSATRQRQLAELLARSGVDPDAELNIFNTYTDERGRVTSSHAFFHDTVSQFTRTFVQEGAYVLT